MKISLGPTPFNWGIEKLKQFYQEMAETPLDTIFIGEVFCEKRNTLTLKELEELMLPLQKKGKELYFSTGSLITDNSQWKRLLQRSEMECGIEANTIGIVHDHKGTKKIVAGPFLNIYHHRSVRFLERFNLAGIVLPFELSKKSIESITSKVKTPVEVVAYGNLPLAVSWRCYIARSCGLSVKRCQFKCMHYPRGIMAENLDGIPLFLINGPYIMSANKRCLIRELEELKTMGVSSIRIIPQYENTSEIVRIFRQAMDHQLSPQDAFEQLSYLSQSSLTNGWFYGEAGWKYIEGDQKFIEEDIKNLLSPLQNIC